jgi:hypothetical protein
LSRESLAFRLERLEQGPSPEQVSDTFQKVPDTVSDTSAAPEASAPVELEQLQEAWKRSILPAVKERSIPIGATLGEARPAALEGDTLTLEFPQAAAFHLRLAEDPKNSALLREALYEVTGRKLAVEFELGEGGHAAAEELHTTEEDVLELMRSTFDARELDE